MQVLVIQQPQQDCIRFAAKAARGSGWLGHFVPTPASTHIFVVAGMLRIPLSQPQKHRIQPERYAT